MRDISRERGLPLVARAMPAQPGSWERNLGHPRGWQEMEVLERSIVCCLPGEAGMQMKQMQRPKCCASTCAVCFRAVLGVQENWRQSPHGPHSQASPAVLHRGGAPVPSPGAHHSPGLAWLWPGQGACTIQSCVLRPPSLRHPRGHGRSLSSQNSTWLK